MIVPLVAALVIAIGSQAPPSDRARAEELARAGRSAEALSLFERIVEQSPADVEARLWIGRLELRLGHTARAEAVFRSVLRDHPDDLDARIGLASAFTRQGAWEDALATLTVVEKSAGQNGELFGALARAYRRAGEDRRALDYFRRAKSLAPADADSIAGFEAAAQAYGHAIAFDGFGEQSSTDTAAVSGTLTVTVRAADRLHVEGTARAQHRSGSSDALAGGGLRWRAGRATTVAVRMLGGAGNSSLPTTDVSGGVVHRPGALELGGGVRWLSFADAEVAAVSAAASWDASGRWRHDTRYTYSRTSFNATDRTSGDHSALLRETWRGWRRVSLSFSYAYGIESFEDFTADRLGSLGAMTVASGLRITLPSLTHVSATWEHQWRSNQTTVDRLTITLVQFIV